MNNTTLQGAIPFNDFRTEVLKLYAPHGRDQRPAPRFASSSTRWRRSARRPATSTSWRSPAGSRAGPTSQRNPPEPPRNPPTHLQVRRPKGYLTNPFADEPLSTWIPADELVAEPFPKHRSAEEIAKVLNQADAEADAGGWHQRRLRFFIYLLAYTGMHDTEARGLRREDLDRTTRLIHIRSQPRRRLKTAARAALVAMADELVSAWDDWEPHIGDNCEYIIPGTRRTGPWSGGPPGYRPLDRVRQLGGRAGVRG